jgi:hypothetical protein
VDDGSNATTIVGLLALPFPMQPKVLKDIEKNAKGKAKGNAKGNA